MFFKGYYSLGWGFSLVFSEDNKARVASLCVSGEKRTRAEEITLFDNLCELVVHIQS